MNYQIESIQKFHYKKLLTIIKKEAVLIIATTLAIITSFFSTPKIEYIDFKVLVLLFNLMVVVAAFKELKVLDSIAMWLLSKCASHKSITATLVFITFFASTIVTNDVALITFVPITLILSKKININPVLIVIFQTLAANLGSSLTPMGNPQNLFIYSFFNIAPFEFFKITMPLFLISIIFLILIIIIGKNTTYNFEIENVKVTSLKKVIIFSVLLFIILLSVFHIIDYKITFIMTLAIVLIINKSLLKFVDYSLLLTFIAFFIFIGNISSMQSINNIMSNLLSSSENTYFSSIVVSQVISNVPSAILMSGFTNHFRELLLGVNIGGLGTLIASLASVISYKLYINEYPSKGRDYLIKFTLINLLGLLLLVPIFYFF